MSGSNWYNSALDEGRHPIDLAYVDVRAMLLTPGYMFDYTSPTLATAKYPWRCIAKNEIFVDGYSRKACKVTLEGDRDRGLIYIEDIGWDLIGVGSEVGCAVIYQNFGHDTVSRPCFYMPVAAEETNGTGFTLKFNPEGAGSWSCG